MRAAAWPQAARPQAVARMQAAPGRGPWRAARRGYDPVHWGVPEGSYASDPDGPARVREFRAMVQALHGRGLHVVLDVVYNHTFHSARDGVRPPRRARAAPPRGRPAALRLLRAARRPAVFRDTGRSGLRSAARVSSREGLQRQELPCDPGG